MTLRESRRGRRLLATLYLGGAGLVVLAMAVGEFLWLRYDHGSQGWSLVGALWVSIGMLVTCVLIGYLVIAPYRPRPVLEWATAVIIGIDSLYFALVTLTPRVDQTISLVVAGVTGVVVTVLVRRDIARRNRNVVRDGVRSIYDEEHADRVVADSEAALAKPGLKPKVRRNAELNLARGLVARGLHGGMPDAIVRATDILRSRLADPDLDLKDTFGVAHELVEAMDRKADMFGDVTGYAEALDVLDAVARRLPADNQAEILVHQARTAYHITLAGRAEDPEERQWQADLAVSEARRAAEHTPGNRSMLPFLYLNLAGCLAMRLNSLSDLDEAVEWCLKAQRLTRWRRRARARVDVAFADLLLTGATELRKLDESGMDQEIGDWIITNVADAIWLSTRAIRATTGYQRHQARWTLARALTRANNYADGPSDEVVADAWRDAADDAARYSLPSLLDVCMDWVVWATISGNPQVCVDACRQFMRVVPQVVMTRYLPVERERVLLRVQDVAAEAGYWLLLAGHAREAAVALELGRAMIASDTIALDRAHGAEAPAPDTGDDLSPRYRGARAVLWGELGGAHDPYTHPAQRAAADVGLVRQQLGGPADVDYGAVAAAAAEGPLVYLAATEEYGYALIIEDPHTEPVSLVLGSFTTDRLREQADRFHAAPPPGMLQRDVVHGLLRWLWENGIAELAARLPADAMVTLVPVGLFGLLPVHAAGGPAAPGAAPADWTFLLDRVKVRYAPNARILSEARRRAADCERAPLTLLAMDAPTGSPAEDLRYTRHELEFITTCWRDTGGAGALLHDATGSAVLRALPDYSVWHWACHAEARPDDIMLSALHLVGGPLYLSDLLRVPPSPRRLAVLSACDSHRTGRLLPDEAVSLPTALMQAGVAGVVAAQWPANDQGTAFFVAKFYELWRRQQLPPADALCAAQRWLRRATRGELNELLPGVLALPADRSPQMMALWESERLFDYPFRWALYAFTGA